MTAQKKKKVMICGASGFIGRNLFEHLSRRKDLDVHGTYLTERFSDDPRLVKVDLTKREQVDKLLKGCDIVLQAAANTSSSKDVVERPYLHVTDNAVMNSFINQATYDHSVSHVVFFSCTAMYDSADHPIKETDLDLNDGMYEKYFGAGWTKLYIEKQCEFYSRLGRTRHTVIRHSNIYGPYDRFDPDKSHVCAATIRKVLEAKDKIVVWGEGTEVRDLLYISDLLSCVDKIIDSKKEKPFQLYNVGCEKGISVDGLVKTVMKVAGKKLKMEYDTSKPTIATKIVLDCNHIRDELGWEAKVSLEEGLQKTISWFKEYVQ